MAGEKTTLEAYDEIIHEIRELMMAKNHDYAESWRYMRPTSITDQILVKIMRIKRLEELQAGGDFPRVSENIESGYRDIVNYSIFALIMLTEEIHG